MIPRMGIVGWHGSGKTTLLARLLPELRRRGLRVSTLKHAHAGFEIDRPGKDSHVHRTAGAREVLVAAPDRWALVHEGGGGDASPDGLLRHLEPVDLVLVEGWKGHPHPKIEVHRPALGRPLLAPEDPNILAVASDAPLGEVGRPVLDLADTAGIADFVVARAVPPDHGPA